LKGNICTTDQTEGVEVKKRFKAQSSNVKLLYYRSSVLQNILHAYNIINEMRTAHKQTLPEAGESLDSKNKLVTIYGKNLTSGD
jgi:hypothetical protein